MKVLSPDLGTRCEGPQPRRKHLRTVRRDDPRAGVNAAVVGCAFSARSLLHKHEGDERLHKLGSIPRAGGRCRFDEIRRSLSTA